MHKNLKLRIVLCMCSILSKKDLKTKQKAKFKIFIKINGRKKKQELAKNN